MPRLKGATELVIAILGKREVHQGYAWGKGTPWRLENKPNQFMVSIPGYIKSNSGG